MTKYNLVNPFIEGNMNTSVKASGELEGAGKIYEQILAPMFITSVSEFKFSIEGDGKLYHYIVKENVKKDSAKFKIEKIGGHTDDKKLKNKLKELKEEEQSGGKSKHKHKHNKDDDSSSSSSSSEESYYRFNRFCYSPYIYSPYINTGYSYTLPYISPTYFYPYSYLNIWG